MSRGFTLIELLVVIAIIGILAAVVIGSLNDARSGGQDASIKQSMANLRQQAELHYNGSNYSYTGLCAADRVTNLIQASIQVVGGTAYVPATHGPVTNVARGSNGNDPASRFAGCRSNDTAYAVVAPLTGGAAMWCVDSTGTSKQLAAAPTAAQWPDGSVPACP